MSMSKFSLIDFLERSRPTRPDPEFYFPDPGLYHHHEDFATGAKREREAEPDGVNVEAPKRARRQNICGNRIQGILANEFPKTPVVAIRNAIEEGLTISGSAKILRLQQLNDELPKIYHRMRYVIPDLPDFKILQNELDAAIIEAYQQYRLDREKKESSMECCCCMTDYNMDQGALCDGETAHFLRNNCVQSQVKSLMEQGKSDLKCVDTSGCGGPFLRSYLVRAFQEETKTLERFEELQQAEDIRRAQVENLEACPFCNFKAILPPVGLAGLTHVWEERAKFSCKGCQVESCRRCKRKWHQGLSCNEAAEKDRISFRQKVDEAKTEAMTRSCNSCQQRFIKGDGCNKMTCPRCGHKQCYVCSKSIDNYDHFASYIDTEYVKAKKCPTCDNTAARHEGEVKAAEEAARQRYKEPTIA